MKETENSKYFLVIFIIAALVLITYAIQRNETMRQRKLSLNPTISVGVGEKAVLVSASFSQGQKVDPGYTTQGARGEEYIGQMIVIVPNMQGGVTAVEPKMLLPSNWVAENSNLWTWEDVIFTEKLHLPVEIIISTSLDQKSKRYEYERYVCYTETVLYGNMRFTCSLKH